MIAYLADDYRRRLKNAADDLDSSPVISLGSFTSDIKKIFYVASVEDNVTAND
jgi:hypothetical protein